MRKVKLYRFNWKCGKVDWARGENAESAFRSLGFGSGALGALDYWQELFFPWNIQSGDIVRQRDSLHMRHKVESVDFRGTPGDADCIIIIKCADGSGWEFLPGELRR